MSEEQTPKTFEDKIRHSLKSVVDPEVGFNIIELGLVYKIDLADETHPKIQMTLTSPMCPVGPEMLAAAKLAMKSVEGVEDAEVQLVWSPPWDPKKHASDDVKAMLGIWE